MGFFLNNSILLENFFLILSMVDKSIQAIRKICQNKRLNRAYRALNIIGYSATGNYAQKISIIVFFYLYLNASFAQQQIVPASFPYSLPFVIEETPFYSFNPLDRQVSLRMSYARSEILNPEAWKNVNQEKQVYEIQLVYTK